ncbi:MAG: hypothetical protein ABJG33_04945, partial [Balneola sp.]
MKYGELPTDLGIHQLECNEMMFYQYLPIKLKGQSKPVFEQRLNPFSDLIGVCLCDYVGEFGLNKFMDSYVYLTVKKQYQTKGCSFNRMGWHSDGFLTDDINYIWSDCIPTVFNSSSFNLSENDRETLKEMEIQANPNNDMCFPDGSLIRLDQFNIHRVQDTPNPILRTFFKLSVSADKYDLKGNSINYLL